jgi:hypothetical protein
MQITLAFLGSVRLDGDGREIDRRFAGHGHTADQQREWQGAEA